MLRRYTLPSLFGLGSTVMLSDIQLVDRSPAGQILKLLQQQGPLSIKAIEAALGVTTTAVRQQLMMLMTADMVTAETVREKRGRPHAVYRLAEKGQALFARGYEELALALLEEVLQLPDPETVRQLLHRISTRLGRQYAAGIHSATVADRLHELSARLTAHGVMSKVDEAADAFVLTEYSCPYYGVAREHREVCGMEIEAMELALGVPVILHQSQLDGHTGCQFQVKK
jgi:predicted ArsR family transcriptional regulator